MKFPDELLAEVSLEETLECSSVSCFVLGHFVNCIVDGVQILLLSLCCQLFLACTCAGFGFYSHLQILLRGISNSLAQQFSELRSMLCFFPCCLFIVKTYFWVKL